MPEEITVKTAPLKAETTPVKAIDKPGEPLKTQVTISTKEEADDINDVIRRFKKNKNPALSLFIAKRYYEMKNYQKAYNYALVTNEIDNNIEESWLIFVKSLVKLGQKEMAVKTLNSYIEHSGSTRAKLLLEDIAQGTFQ